MKERRQPMSKFLLVTLSLTIVVLSGCGPSQPVPAESDDVARGREQMIRALDAAWVRVIASGQYDEILATEPAEDPGAAQGFVVRMADCLPLPDLTPYPEQPVGLLKKVIDTGQVRRMVQDVPDTPGSTAHYFTGITIRYFEAVLAELGDHYGVEIGYTSVGYPPGSLASTTALINDEVDVVSQLNATGGRTQDLRRRISRRFGCTMVASSQFIQIPQDSQLVDEINSLTDLIARPDVRVCAGPLTTQTAKAFMPEHKIMTRYIDDIAQCDDKIKRGKADIMINPLPDLSIAGYDGYTSVHTLLVAGTPLWVALEGIACDVEPASGRGELECREIEPL
jgi:hypothetical protein